MSESEAVYHPIAKGDAPSHARHASSLGRHAPGTSHRGFNLGRVFLISLAVAVAGVWLLIEAGPSWRRLAHREAASLLVANANVSWPPWHANGINPVQPDEPLYHDDRLVLRPHEPLRTDRLNVLTFSCEHDAEDVALRCPESYRVWLVGPSLHSPPDSAAVQIDSRTVQISFRIADPGRYKLYAWPEHRHCERFRSLAVMHNREAVRGAPLNVEVSGPAPTDNPSLCPRLPRLDRPTRETSSPGRWIDPGHLNHLHLTPASPYWSWLSSHLSINRPAQVGQYRYIYAPHECKVPHLTHAGWVELVRPRHLLVVGDSMLRSMFCRMLWADLDGPSPSACTPSDDITHYHTSAKDMTYRRRDGDVSRFSFHWNPLSEPDRLDAVLATYDPPPSHIVFQNAFWFLAAGTDLYERNVTLMLDVFARRAPDAAIIIKTGSSVVQAQECFERIDAQRYNVEAHNRALEAAIVASVAAHPDLELATLSAYAVTDSRPETSWDGRHWGWRPSKGDARAEAGAAEEALSDMMWFHFAQLLS